LENGRRFKKKSHGVRYQTDLTRIVKGKPYKVLTFMIDDPAWLDAAQYPVTLDPTTNFGQPGKDNLIYRQLPDSPDTSNELILIGLRYRVPKLLSYSLGQSKNRHLWRFIVYGL